MRLVRYGNQGHEKPGLLDARGALRDLSGHVADITPEVLDLTTLDWLANLDPMSLPEVTTPVRIGPCVGGLRTIFGAGLNYHSILAEAGRPAPAEPVIFMKSVNAVCGAADDIVIPVDATQAHWEVELAVVMGRTVSGIAPEQVLPCIAGYCVANDITERGWIESSKQLVMGKCADTFLPLGPWLVTRSEVEDPQKLELFLDVNGERVQQGTTADMVFDVARVVSYLSGFTTLRPGDVVLTGSPAGNGPYLRPPRFLKSRDRIRAGIVGLGEQRYRVTQRPPGPVIS